VPTLKKNNAAIPVAGKTNIAKPFLKWAGGKTQLLQQFNHLYPLPLKEGKIKNYYEPFLGSGAVFFHIIQQYKIEKAWLYDINPELIITYKVIQQNVDALIKSLSRLQKKYYQLDKQQQADFFYTQRKKYNNLRLTIDYTTYNDGWVERAAQLIFLNRTCFNGLYRVNAKGEFNTPAGKYNNPLICDVQNLRAVSAALKNAVIKLADFKAVKKDIKKNAFVYFDPPYRPLTKTASFKAYAKEDFTDENQKELAIFFAYVTEKDCMAMLSNSDPKNNNAKDTFFDILYKNYYLRRIPARRMINADAAKRGKINEIVVTNYLAG
jgi:DNA adenine methylase